MSVKNIWNDVPQTVHNKVLETLDSLEKSKLKLSKRSTFYKVAAACMIVVCVSGITVYAAEAIHSYKQRMLEMNKQQLEEYYAAAFPSHTIQFSRDLTKQEERRYKELKEAYETEGAFPTGAVKYLEDISDYRGKGIALYAPTGILYLPDKNLSDEEILQVIDFFHKVHYSIYALNEERKIAENPWLERLQTLTDEEVDKAYIAMYTGEVEVSGRMSRKLSIDEEARYNELIICYEEENWIPGGEILVIETAEEYTAETVALCRKDSTFYLPERALTDEEFLQIIDMNHKASYSISRIGEEIRMGFRTGYPGYPKIEVTD